MNFIKTFYNLLTFFILICFSEIILRVLELPIKSTNFFYSNVRDSSEVSKQLQNFSFKTNLDDVRVDKKSLKIRKYKKSNLDPIYIKNDGHLNFSGSKLYKEFIVEDILSIINKSKL